MSDLSNAERHWIARALLSRAHKKSRNLESAIRNECHPKLIEELHADVQECTRLALKLQECPASHSGTSHELNTPK